MKSKSLRILYAVGPEDVIQSYKSWSQGEQSSAQVSVTYSSQFYDVCHEFDAQAYVIAQAKTHDLIQGEQFMIEKLPVPLPNAGGIVYHLRQIFYGIKLLISALQFRANVLIASSGTTHWFVLYLFSWLGIRVIPSVHCVLWREYGGQSRGEKIALYLSRNLFANKCAGILAVSNEIARQIQQLTVKQNSPILEFLPSYRPKDFADIPPPSPVRSPFHVLFAGRVEYDKGVFDLLEIAQTITASGIHDIHFHICGGGSQLETLRHAVRESGLTDSFFCHGYLLKPQMREMFARSHIVVVPTRTEFVEGFNRVVAESILCGRPVVTSPVCPALSYVDEAVISVFPEDISAYREAILLLYRDLEIYNRKRLACQRLQSQFYDRDRSWGNRLKTILNQIIEAEANQNHNPDKTILST